MSGWRNFDAAVPDTQETEAMRPQLEEDIKTSRQTRQQTPPEDRPRKLGSRVRNRAYEDRGQPYGSGNRYPSTKD